MQVEYGGLLLFQTYKKNVYGFMNDMTESELKNAEGFTYSNLLKRDRRRWVYAGESISWYLAGWAKGQIALSRFV